MEFSRKSKKEKETCGKNSSSSFASAMLCFLHGFNDADQKNPNGHRSLRFRLLRKSRSSTNFHATSTTASMVVPRRSHSRTHSTQSAILPHPADVGAQRAVQSLAGSASAASLLQVHRSPSPHQGTFTKMDKASLKLLSTSSPVMTAQSQLNSPPSPQPTDANAPSVSKSRQKKFHRHFPAVDDEEKVLNYYSCALIGDILLQGHLYITKNYFAFYSNVFGYVTKLLIPMLTVQKITKEKTARIIPNAVGITTTEDKHVFGSLMSRDNTFKYMTKVWEVSQKAMELVVEAEVFVEPDNVEVAASETDSSEAKEESEKDCATHSHIEAPPKNRVNVAQNSSDYHFSTGRHKLFEVFECLVNLPTQTLVLIAATFLLVILFLSASLLLIRIGRIHDKYVALLEDHEMASNDIYSQLLRFSMKLHSKSAYSVHNYVDSNLQQIAKVRQDLEILSSLLLPKGSSNDAKDSQQEFSTKNS